MLRLPDVLAVLLLSFVAGLVAARPVNNLVAEPQAEAKALAMSAPAEPAEASKPVAPTARAIRVILPSPYQVRTE
jgi:hypothetical protein